MKKMKLSGKIIGAFTAVILLMTGVIGVGMLSNQRICQGFQALLDGQVSIERHGAQAETMMERALDDKNSFLLTMDLKTMDDHKKNVAGLIEHLGAIRAIEVQS